MDWTKTGQYGSNWQETWGMKDGGLVVVAVEEKGAKSVGGRFVQFM